MKTILEGFRGFLKEASSSLEGLGAQRVEDYKAREARDSRDVWQDSDLESLKAKLPGQEVLNPTSFSRDEAPEAIMPMATVLEKDLSTRQTNRIVYFKTFGTHKYYKISLGEDPSTKVDPNKPWWR